MNIPNPDYQVIYGVNLLDDLHNYFPDFLYNQQRFHNVQSVFHYMRHQLHARFNLYSFGARLNQQTSPFTQQPLPRTPRPTVSPFASPFAARPAQQQEEDILGNLNAANILLTMLGTGLGTGQAQAGWGQPVIVRPTAAVLERNTTLVAGTPGQRCAICQDEMRAEESCRRLNACNHLFHRSCIDQWFERSVRCPQCRHDIREPAAALPPQAERQTPPF